MFWKLYAIAFPVFLAIDMVWLIFIAKKFYAEQIGYIMTKNPNLIAAFAFYLLFIAGLIVFVITPALDKRSWIYALGMGAFFGLVTYATYDLTNLATLRDWPMLVTVVDLIWGTTLAWSVSLISYMIAVRMGV